jgi:hypothetical protein
MSRGHKLSLVNRGAQRLLELYPNRGDLTRIAGERGIDQGYLSRIARDERRPGTATRRLFWEGPERIPMHWWDEAVPPSERDRSDTDPDDPPTEPGNEPPSSESNPKINTAPSMRGRVGSG